jgi:RNA polymerase sigma-70 factor (ECF subfamily)
MKITQQHSDAELIRQYQNGSNTAFDCLIKKYQVNLLNRINFLVKDHSLAEDLLQDTLVRIINTLQHKSYQEIGKFLPWATTIAHNIVIDHKRKMKTKPEVLPFENDIYQYRISTYANQESKLIDKEKAEWVKHHINRLPKAQREVIVLKLYGALTFKEIGEITQSNINTALGRMQYGINNLRKTIVHKKMAA